MSLADDIEREVRERCDELTPDLLPLVFKRMIARDGMVACERHMTLLGPYVRAQIHLGRAKRNYFEWDYEGAKAIYEHALEIRNAARVKYRGTPCTCWATHR